MFSLWVFFLLIYGIWFKKRFLSFWRARSDEVFSPDLEHYRRWKLWSLCDLRFHCFRHFILRWRFPQLML
jgi:hypothetical protein